MTKFLIASHGNLASGMLSTIQIIGGNNFDIQCIDAFTEGVDLLKEIKSFIESVDKKEQAIIFSDLKGGSVNQKIFNTVMSSKEKNIKIITGFNLPLVMTLVLENTQLTDSVINEAINEARNQIELLDVDTLKNYSEKENQFF